MAGEAPGGLPFAYRALDAAVEARFVPITTSDGADLVAIYYAARGHRPKAAVLVVHPRGDYTRFYAAPGLARAGYGVLCLGTRYLNNDIDAQHERMLLDLAAGMRFLRGEVGDALILFGNSGGGSLTTFYQAQAQLAPAERLARAAGGDRVPLAGEEMPLAQAQIQVAVHIGEGHFMLKSIDPAVVDEADPSMTDPALDMYHPANGRRPYPEPSRYDPAWLARYRAAQADRCRRLDARARAWLGARFAGEAAPGDAANVEVAYTRQRLRRAVRYLTVYRTLANPTYLDPTIDPSARGVGSSFTQGIDPLIGNYGMNGLGRVLTPRAWLSTWSPFATHADMTRSLRSIRLPSLFVQATGDTEILPGEFREIVDACPAEDKTVLELPGNHYLRPLAPGDADPRTVLDGILAEWLGARRLA